MRALDGDARRVGSIEGDRELTDRGRTSAMSAFHDDRGARPSVLDAGRGGGAASEGEAGAEFDGERLPGGLVVEPFRESHRVRRRGAGAGIAERAVRRGRAPAIGEVESQLRVDVEVVCERRLRDEQGNTQAGDPGDLHGAVGAVDPVCRRWCPRSGSSADLRLHSGTVPRLWKPAFPAGSQVETPRQHSGSPPPAGHCPRSGPLGLHGPARRARSAAPPRPSPRARRGARGRAHPR